MAIILDINKKSNNVNALITLRQADQGIQKEQFKILKDGMPYDLNGKIVKFEGTMPNGFFTIGHCTITNSKNGECEYTFTLKDTSVAGVYQQAYIRVYKGQDQIASQNIQVKVLRNSDLDPEQAKYYLKEYDKLLSDLKDYVDSGKSSWEDFVDQNREIIESVDPGGLLLSRIGIFNNFREWDYTVIEKMANEFIERSGNPKWYGAKFDGVTDDTEAINQCLQKHKSIKLPPGTTVISDTLIMNNVEMSGSQRQGTRILMTTTDPKKPIVRMGKHSKIQAVELMFKSTVLPSTFSDGDYVGIQLDTNEYTLHRGIINDVIIDGCGTGIYAPKSAFSCSFEDITIFNARHKYMHFSGTTRTGNVYKNIYMSEQGSNKFKSVAAIWFEGEESDGTMEQINIEHMQVKRAAYFENCRAMDISSFHIEGVEIYEPQGGFIEFVNSNMRFGGLTGYYTRGHIAGQSFFLFGDGYQNKNLSGKQCVVTIDNLFFKGLNRPNGMYSKDDYPYDTHSLGGIGVQPWYFAKRISSYTDSDYILKINSYDWYTWSNISNDNNLYNAFETAGNLVVDFNIANHYKKTGREITIIKPPYYNDIKLEFAGVIGNSNVTENGTISNPLKFNYSPQTHFKIGSTNKEFETSLLSLKTSVGMLTDELNLVSGEITKRCAMVELSDKVTVKDEGDFIVYYLPFRPKLDKGSNFSKTTHIPKGSYNLNYGALYISKYYLQTNGVFEASDSSEIKVQKFKSFLNSQKNNGTPVTVCYERETFETITIDKENYFLNADINIVATSPFIEAKGGYSL